jgi:hypothetical protein
VLFRSIQRFCLNILRSIPYIYTTHTVLREEESWDYLI